MDLTLTLVIMFLVPLLVVLIPIMIGERYGQYQARKLRAADAVSVGSVVTAALGLLAFILAFTFQMASNRYDNRKQLLVQEVDHIRTAFLRSGLIHEPIRSKTKELLIEYVNLRVDLVFDPSKIGYSYTRSEQILDSCWRFAETLAKEDRSSEVYALYTSSINDLYSSYNERLTVVMEFRIPKVVFWILGIITVLSMLALGYQFGISGKGNFNFNLLLAIIFAVVMLLIMVLDHPETGLVKVSQQPMIKLQKELTGAGR